MSECYGDGGLELHPLMGHRMLHAQQESMQTETVYRVVSISVFHVTTYWMSHISGMHTDLVLTTRLQLELHQRVVRSTVKDMEMGHRIFSPIINR